MKNKRNLSLTVGITTCYGGESILKTVRSIRNSIEIKDFDFILVADRVPISDEIKKELIRLKVNLIENNYESSQFKKKKQILKLVKTEIIIFTNDDVLFDSNTLKATIDEFTKDPDLTLISVFNRPIPSHSIIENAISVGTNIGNRIIQNWNQGDNYLSVIGRYEALRTDFLKQNFKMHDDVVSSDQYIYLENKKAGGKYKYLPQVCIYFKNPGSLMEHLRKSSRFQYAKQEMSKYFKDISNEYKIPGEVFIKSIFTEFFTNPINFSVYILIVLYTRLFRISSKKSINPVWQVDLSTKIF